MRRNSLLILFSLLAVAAVASQAKERDPVSGHTGETLPAPLHHDPNAPRSRTSRRSQLRLHQAEEEELLKSEHLLHVKPRNTTGLDGLKNDRKSATISKKFGAKTQQSRGPLVFKNFSKTAAKEFKKHERASNKEFKKRDHQKGFRASKKYDAKKHAWKKNQHKEKAKKREHIKERKRASDSLRELIKGHKAHKRQVREKKRLAKEKINH